MNLKQNLKKYLVGDGAAEGRSPNARYTSFDYCFNYFQSFRVAENIPAMAEPKYLQSSCLQLGFYLASWGMMRGSAPLLQRSARCLVPIIEVIARSDAALWRIDAHRYTEENISRLIDFGRTLDEAHSGGSDTFVTKVMLGVFGNTPAFDANFKRGLQASYFGPKALRKIGSFYRDNWQVVEEYRVKSLNFLSGRASHFKYSRAKVIDMAFFVEGLRHRR